MDSCLIKWYILTFWFVQKISTIVILYHHSQSYCYILFNGKWWDKHVRIITLFLGPNEGHIIDSVWSVLGNRIIMAKSTIQTTYNKWIHCWSIIDLTKTLLCPVFCHSRPCTHMALIALINALLYYLYT